MQDLIAKKRMKFNYMFDKITVDDPECSRVLVIVDAQLDFMPGGALAVDGGDQIIPYINQLIESGKYEYIVATQDWHPANHGSFASKHNVPPFTMGELDGLPQMMWPDHCIQGTPGAELHPDLSPRIHAIIRKGMSPDRDSYSGVKDNGDWSTAWYTGLELLIANVVADVVDIVGLATDFCVGHTALDLIETGFTVRVLLKGCRGVNPESTSKMIAQLIEAGVEIIDG
jgi:nicotinamidase/pyrazinamidase